METDNKRIPTFLDLLLEDIRAMRSAGRLRLIKFASPPHTQGSWSCQRCGSCCRIGQVLLDVDEVAALQDIPAAAGLIVGADPEGVPLHVVPMPCPCLKEDAHCTIFEHRPLICRAYPFFVIAGEVYVDSCCPGVGVAQSSAAKISPLDLAQVAQAIAGPENAAEVLREIEKALVGP